MLNNIALQGLTRPFRIAWLPAQVQGVAISIWVVLVTSASLKWVVPYIHWYASAALIGVLALSLPRPRWTDLRLPLVTSAALTMAICTLVFVSKNPVYEVLEAGKLAIILLLLLPLLTTSAALALAALRGAEISIWINLATVLAARFGGTALGAFLSDGRVGSVINAPGSPWHLAMLLLVLSSVRFLSGSGSMRHLMLFATCIFLIVLDGSRTAYLMFPLAACMLAAEFRRCMRRERQSPRPFAPLVRPGQMTAAVAVTLGAKYWLFPALPRAPEDGSRMQMLRDVVHAIGRHPMVGTGMGTTMSNTIYGPMVIHMGYLQVWADVGLLGFVSFATLNLGVIPALWTRYQSKAQNQPQLALFYNGIFLLMCWAAAAALHPISTELTEWIVFLLGYCSASAAWNRSSAYSAVDFQKLGQESNRLLQGSAAG